MSFGSFDFSSFQKFADNFEKEYQRSLQVSFVEQVMNMLGNIVVGNVKQRTPVGDYGPKLVQFTTKDGQHVSFVAKGNGRVGGHLKRNWKMKKCQKVGNTFIVTIYNNVNYAPYVENGHRTRNGGWVEGQYMLKITMDEIEEKFPQIVGRKYEEFLQRFMKG